MVKSCRWKKVTKFVPDVLEFEAQYTIKFEIYKVYFAWKVISEDII